MILMEEPAASYLLRSNLNLVTLVTLVNLVTSYSSTEDDHNQCRKFTNYNVTVER